MASQMLVNGKPVSEEVAAEFERLAAERDALRRYLSGRLTELDRRIQALEAGTVVRQNIKPSP